MAQDSTNLIWIDLEMTGLDPQRDTIIEIATVITNAHLQIIAEGPVLAISHPPATLAQMDEWNTQHHTESGLTQRVLDSQITLAAAEQHTLQFLQEHVPPNTSPMCGNTVSQDRLFLNRYMPNLEKYFHYRQIDVSTLKELKRRWLPEIPDFSKISKHLALSDIYESIEELRYYRTHIFKLD